MEEEQEKPKKAKKEKAPSRLYYNVSGEMSTEQKSKKDIEYMQSKDHEKTINKLIEDFRGIMVEFSSCIKSKVQNQKIKSNFDSIISKY